MARFARCADQRSLVPSWDRFRPAPSSLRANTNSRFSSRCIFLRSRQPTPLSCSSKTSSEVEGNFGCDSYDTSYDGPIRVHTMPSRGHCDRESVVLDDIPHSMTTSPREVRRLGAVDDGAQLLVLVRQRFDHRREVRVSCSNVIEAPGVLSRLNDHAMVPRKVCSLENR